jgi:hypothetical protein
MLLRPLGINGGQDHVRFRGEPVGGNAVQIHVPVEVRSRYDGQWAAGFQIADRTEHGYRLRRLSDDTVLPGEFSPDDIRRTAT